MSSVETKIYLNSHAKKEYVFKVILKIIGTEFIQFGGNYIDKNKPSSKDNKWEIKFIENRNNKIQKNDEISALTKSTAYNIYFENCIRETYSCMYYSKCNDDNYCAFDNARLLCASSVALWGVIGKRLVDFFGGKVFFCHPYDRYIYVCNNPKYPPKTEKESDYDQWFRFQNTLFNEPTIKAQELKDMKNETKYWHAEDFVAYLEKYEAALELANYLSTKNKTMNKKIKI